MTLEVLFFQLMHHLAKQKFMNLDWCFKHITVSWMDKRKEQMGKLWCCLLARGLYLLSWKRIHVTTFMTIYQQRIRCCGWGYSFLNQRSRVQALRMEKSLVGSVSPPNEALRDTNLDIVRLQCGHWVRNQKKEHFYFMTIYSQMGPYVARIWI